MKTQKLSSYEAGDTVYRHGDVLLKKTDRKIAEGGKALTRIVLHKGQNHDHTLQGYFSLVEDGGRKFIEVLKPSTLDHEEHGPIKLQPMDTALELDIQLEYDHFLKESRQVID